MTPFGARLRELRRERGLTLKAMAAELGLSSAYLSALEHGHRGRPTFALVQRICAHFGIIWDEAEALQHLADLSHPRVIIPTAGLNPKATALANRLAACIDRLPEETLDRLLAEIEPAEARPPGPKAKGRKP